MTLLLFVEAMIRNERVYKKEAGWIWQTLIDLSEEPQFNLRSEAKRLARMILTVHKEWKQEVNRLKKDQLERIDRMLRNMGHKGKSEYWMEAEGQEFERIILGRIVNNKYFGNHFAKFEEQDRLCVSKKNWKERGKLLSDLFLLACQHPAEFVSNPHLKKYMSITLEHLDDKNPGLLLNAIGTLHKVADTFPQVLEDCLATLV